MLPVTHGVKYTRWQILLYTVLLFVVTMLPAIVGMSGWFYLGGAIVLGAMFLWYAWKLMDPPDEFFAMRVFNYSVVYLMALFAFLLLDHWLMPWLQPASGLQFAPVYGCRRAARRADADSCRRAARTRPPTACGYDRKHSG